MIDALLLGIKEALFILLRLSLNSTKAINICGDMKASMLSQQNKLSTGEKRKRQKDLIKM